MKLLKSITLAVATLVGSTIAAAAHTVSYGYIAGANPGEVVFWFGSYHSNSGAASIPFESQLQLTGVSGTTYGPQIFNFDTASATLPSGLVTGTNYFYADTATFYESNPSSVVSWMGVTATGLDAGEYTFELQNTATTTAYWQLWDNSIGAQFTLTAGNIGGGGTGGTVVPLPASLPLVLAGLGALGLVARRRRTKA